MEQQNTRCETIKYKKQNIKIEDMELLGDTEQQNTRHGAVTDIQDTEQQNTRHGAITYKTRNSKIQDMEQ